MSRNWGTVRTQGHSALTLEKAMTFERSKIITNNEHNQLRTIDMIKYKKFNIQYKWPHSFKLEYLDLIWNPRVRNSVPWIIAWIVSQVPMPWLKLLQTMCMPSSMYAIVREIGHMMSSSNQFSVKFFISWTRRLLLFTSTSMYALEHSKRRSRSCTVSFICYARSYPR